MSIKIVLLNAPPGSGKDTLGNIIADRGLAVACSFKDKLFDIALSTSGISAEDWFSRYDIRELKERPWTRLGGLSQRQFMIRVSEEWLKPTFGVQFFGFAAIDAIEKIQKENGRETPVIFMDSGFPDETDVLIDNGYDVFIIQLYREGFTFKGDSRNYLQGYPQTIRIDLIDGDPESAADHISRIVWGC